MREVLAVIRAAQLEGDYGDETTGGGEAGFRHQGGGVLVAELRDVKMVRIGRSFLLNARAMTGR